MRIVYVYDDSLDRPDGVTQYVLTVSEWMKSQGHEVFYIVGETRRTDLDNVYSVSRNKTWKFNGNKIAVPFGASYKTLNKVLDEIMPDVMHVQGPYHPLLAGRTIKVGRKLFGEKLRIVSTFHIMPYGTIPKLGTNLLGIVSRQSLKLIDQAMAVSAPAQKFAADIYCQKDVIVVPNCVDLKKYEGKSKISSDLLSRLNNYDPAQNTIPKIIFVGRADVRKGAPWLISALSEIKNRELGQFQAIFAGRWSQADMNNLMLLAEKSGLVNSLPSALVHPEVVERDSLPSSVSFVGEVTESDKRALLASADIAVYPSTGGESFGIVLIEAMAAGRPVTLGCDNPGYASVLSDTPEALFSQGKNMKDSQSNLVEILVKYIKDSKLRTDIASQQNKAVKQFDVNVVGKRLLEMYKLS